MMEILMSKKDPNWKNICVNCNFEHPKNYNKLYCLNCNKTRRYKESDECLSQRKDADQKRKEEIRKNIDKNNRELRFANIMSWFLVFLLLSLFGGLIYSTIYYPDYTLVFFANFILLIVVVKFLEILRKK